jgi:hypothetical protein
MIAFLCLISIIGLCYGCIKEFIQSTIELIQVFKEERREKKWSRQIR